ncbi:MAG TPA: NAD(P)-dependent oxidoreductase [Bdellovibrionota bacterium]|nr:NAD(P)-dependent oxidoreductase [Bdellovibrionota bacterium]
MILVTGAHGFIGAPLLKVLRAAGLDARASELDLLKPETVSAEIGSLREPVVIHLAGMSHVPTCEKDPALALRTNRDGTRSVGEAVARAGGRLVFASTAQVYAAAEGDEIATQALFTESRRIAPQNAYARSKWEAEEALRGIEGLQATILRLFSHTHKSQSQDFFLSHVYAQLKSGKREIPVGNLEIHRDFGALSDLLAAFRILAGSPRPGAVYNVCSGRAKHLGKLARGLAERMGVEARFVTDPARVRKGEPVALVGSHERLTSDTGWRPKHVTESELLDSFLAEL